MKENEKSLIQKIQSTLFNKNFDDTLSDNQLKQIQHTIKVQNWRRGQILFAVVLFFEILLIVFHDIPAIRALTYTAFIAWGYFLLHLMIGITVIIGLVTICFFLRREPQRQFETKDVYSSIFILLLTVFLSLICGIDQKVNNQISVYIISLLVPGVLILIKPPENYFVYSVPHMLFIAGMFVFQADPVLRSAHIINGTVFFVCALVISRFIYENQVSHLIKNIKLEEANQKLSFFSAFDPLTKLSNRRNFEQQISKHEGSEIGKLSAILMLMDIDNFKLINDQYGHPAGDEVLQEIAHIIQSNIRDIDLAARWGGEEFLLLIRNDSLEHGKQLGERLRKIIAESCFQYGGSVITTTVSIGVVLMPFLMDYDFQKAYHDVDQALYRAKQQGRNRVIALDYETINGSE
jgi:diguanylate cyclase (GGDEF)-like protein